MTPLKRIFRFILLSSDKDGITIRIRRPLKLEYKQIIQYRMFVNEKCWLAKRRFCPQILHGEEYLNGRKQGFFFKSQNIR